MYIRSLSPFFTCLLFIPTTIRMSTKVPHIKKTRPPAIPPISGKLIPHPLGSPRQPLQQKVSEVSGTGGKGHLVVRNKVPHVVERPAQV